MSYIFFCIFSFLSNIFGILFTYLYFYIKKKKESFSWLQQCSSYEHAFQSVVKDLERELGIRKNLEQRLQINEDVLKKLYAKIALSEERIDSLSSYPQRYDIISDELRIQREINIVQKEKIKQMASDLERKECEVLEKKKLLFDFEERFSEKFEVLANRIFDYNEKRIDKQNIFSLDKLLSPLRLQLEEFNREMNRKFSQEECERHTLSHEIHNLERLNMKMVQETINLTRALKGNNKLQGTWGEVVLNRILASSGMREGHEFHTQTNILTDDGRRLQPDIIVHLPGNKDIIIDAKTSLLSYEKYFNSESDSDRKNALSDHISSLRSHMKLLSKKDYQSLYSRVQTLDCVLMFIPIESAFILAINNDSSLLTQAIEYNIILVSPTTLLVTLRIINNLWRYEFQNRYTKEIADRASQLYDKLRLFVNDINKIGQYLDKVQSSYCLAKKKLYEGSGNLISQAEKFRVFGVKVKRPILSNIKEFPTFQCFSSSQNQKMREHLSSDINNSVDINN